MSRGGSKDVRPTGLSTLDLLASAELNRDVSTKVRQEMAKLSQANTAEAQQATRLRVHDMNTLGLSPDPPPLGEQGANKKNLLHGTVAERRLIAGRLVRTTDLDEEDSLITSVPAPELSRAIARQVRTLKATSQSEQDALDIVLNSSCDIRRDEKPEVSNKVPPRCELSIAEQERIALRQQESQLQVQLLHATQKLSRKYQQQLDRHRKVPASSKIHVLAQKWEEQGRQSPENEGAMSTAADNEQYKLYMASRFSSQTELDFYPRKIEPREPATDKHRRHSMHTKYGNALVKAKSSLRGPF